jgi:hypothetical protein
VRTLQVALMNAADKTEELESVKTDAEGRFTIPWPGMDEDGTRVRLLVASAEGLESRCLYVSAEPEKEVVFRLGPGAAISGHVVTVAGTPVAGAGITNEFMRADIAMNPDTARAASSSAWPPAATMAASSSRGSPSGQVPPERPRRTLPADAYR